MGVSGTALGYWIRNERMCDKAKAQRLADLSGFDVREP